MFGPVVYNTVMDKRARIYRIISAVVLGMCIYALLLPVISPFMNRLFPDVWTCPFLKLTGHECPFCGTTRDMHSIYKMNIGGAGMFSLVALLAILCEAAFRLIILLAGPSIRPKGLGAIIIFDASVHTLLAAALAIYVIMFLTTIF